MGMFDSVYFKCPNCGKDIEEQSKAGECLLISYHQTEVPLEIANSILGDDLHCYGCDKSFKIVTDDDIPPPVTIKMKLA